MILEFFKNLLEVVLFLFSQINPIYHLLKIFNVNENMGQILFQVISLGGELGLIGILALIQYIKQSING